MTLLLEVIVVHGDRLLGGDPQGDVVLPITAHEDFFGKRGVVLMLQLGAPQTLLEDQVFLL